MAMMVLTNRADQAAPLWQAAVAALAEVASERLPVGVEAAAQPSKIRDVNFAYQRLVVALTDDFLDEADKGTPQLGVADLRERPDQ
jgi:hypothetical protein